MGQVELQVMVHVDEQKGEEDVEGHPPQGHGQKDAEKTFLLADEIAPERTHDSFPYGTPARKHRGNRRVPVIDQGPAPEPQHEYKQTHPAKEMVIAKVIDDHPRQAVGQQDGQGCSHGKKALGTPPGFPGGDIGHVGIVRRIIGSGTEKCHEAVQQYEHPCGQQCRFDHPGTGDNDDGYAPDQITKKKKRLPAAQLVGEGTHEN